MVPINHATRRVARFYQPFKWLLTKTMKQERISLNVSFNFSEIDLCYLLFVNAGRLSGRPYKYTKFLGVSRFIR